MSIPGECVGPAGRVPVLISRLASDGCALKPGAGGHSIEGPQVLWIGAIGPIPAVATRGPRGVYRAHFEEPLDARIVEHFAGASKPRQAAARRQAARAA